MSNAIPNAIESALGTCVALHGWSDAERAILTRYLESVRFSAGAIILVQGADGLDMYFCLAGDARALRDGVEVGRHSQGDHFGELGLILGRSRAASIVARTDVHLARLTREEYVRLKTEQPLLAEKLLEGLLASLAVRLTEMTDNVSRLLHERSLPRRTHIQVRLGGEVRPVRTGVAASELLPDRLDGKAVVAALVDRKAVSLTTALTSDCELKPLTADDWEGQRIYRHSLGLLLLEAAHRVDPGLRLRLAHSVGFGQRVQLVRRPAMALDQLAQQLGQTMRSLCAAGAVLHEELWTVDEATEYFADEGSGDVEQLLSTWREPAVPMCTYGAVYVLRPGPLVDRTARLTGFDVTADGEGLLLLYGDEGTTVRVVSGPTKTLLGVQEPWLRTLGITSAGAFNRACIEGSVEELIRVNEGFHEKALGRIADRIAEANPTTRVVCVAGPSSSGKTTFIKRLRVQLQVNGKNPIGISLDDYYCDRNQTPRDARGELDYESLHALRLDLLSDHLDRLLRGETVRTAHYDFLDGKSNPSGGAEIHLGRDDVLMLEGIHGLNPAILPDDAEKQTFRIFVCPLGHLPFDRLTRIHTSDLRLLRRIVRDRHTRNINAEGNILRWPSVRAGERAHIFPFQHRADAVFDSSLIYELSVLKVYAERYLFEVSRKSAAYTTAFRLLELLAPFVTIYPDHVPPTSILREFIGGSGFEY